MSCFREYHVFKNSLVMGPGVSRVGGSHIFGRGIAGSTITVVSLGDFLFSDTFNSLDSASWLTSGLASATASGGQLVTEGAESSWQAYTTSAAKYLGTIPNNFSVEVGLEWVGRSGCLGEMVLLLQTATHIHYVGVSDQWESNDPQYCYSINGNVVGTGYNTAPFSGSVALKAVFSDGTLTLYREGTQVASAAISGLINGVYLANTRLSGYNGLTAKWDNFYMIEA